MQAAETCRVPVVVVGSITEEEAAGAGPTNLVD